MPKSQKLGKNTSAEVLNVSKQGIWILVQAHEYFMSHQDFPWFQDANINEISNVVLLHNRHLHWPDLDVDLELGSLKDLEKYPLIYK